jgi:DNA-binding transcriptional regulator PaaX
VCALWLRRTQYARRLERESATRRRTRGKKSTAPLNLRELVEALGADRRTVRKALVGLLAQGSIAASGKAPKLRYGVPEKPQITPRAKKAVRVSSRTTEGRATYEAAVLAALRDKGEQTPLSALIKETGGTDNQLRAALRRLIAAGKVDRTGERDRTRFSVRRQPPPST